MIATTNNEFANREKDARDPSKRVLVLTIWFGALLLAAYGPTLYALMVESLENPDFSHVVFAPLVAGYITWTMRGQLLAQRAQGSNLGLVLVFAGLLMLCIGPPSLATFTFVKRFGFLFSLIGTILFLGGFVVLRMLAYPLLLLILMIPLPSFVYDRLTLPLQLLASQLSEITLEWLGFSVLREGNVLHMRSQVVSVVEACSGLRSLYALVFLTLAYAFFVTGSAVQRTILISAAIPVAIVANAGRVTTTAILGEYAPQYTHGIYHDMLGWSVFVFGFLLLLLIHRIMNWLARMRS
jgi:exosortase